MPALKVSTPFGAQDCNRYLIGGGKSSCVADIEESIKLAAFYTYQIRNQQGCYEADTQAVQ